MFLEAACELRTDFHDQCAYRFRLSYASIKLPNFSPAVQGRCGILSMEATNE